MAVPPLRRSSMSDSRYAPIYGRNPWLMVEDADEVADFFRNSGTPFVSHRRDIVHFGSQPHVYWIESGLVASSATTDVDKVMDRPLLSQDAARQRARHRSRQGSMTLMATAVTDVSGFAVPLELYARSVSENPERERAMLLNCIAKSECQVEGVLVNDLCSVDDRVEIAVAVLFRAAGITEAHSPARAAVGHSRLRHREPRARRARHDEPSRGQDGLKRSARAFGQDLRAQGGAAREPASGGRPERPRWSSVLPGTAGLGRRKLREYDGARHQHAAEELPLGEHFAEQQPSPRSRRWRSRGS